MVAVGFTRMLEVAHNVAIAVQVLNRLRACGFRLHGYGQDARELAGVDVEGPDVVVVAPAGISG
jgi:hypothetical protein